jgi:dienelactone hydrolase
MNVRSLLSLSALAFAVTSIMPMPIAAQATQGAAKTKENAVIRTQTFDYKQGDTVLEGFIAWDDARTGKMPGVLVFSQWTGPSDHERNAARELAKLGYVAMVADVYGKGIHPPAPKESGIEVAKYINNRALLRARVRAGFDRLLADSHVDASNIAAIGYCFGGAGALELGRQGANVRAIVVFHGTLSNPTPADARNIKAHVLVLHGADDPNVPQGEVEAFKAEMKEANVDLEFVAYSGTVHSFTINMVGYPTNPGSHYNAVSAKRSWIAMQDFLKETLGQ